MFARGILVLGSHNMSYVHTDADITKLLTVYGEVLPILKDAVDRHQLNTYLRCKPIVSLFKIR